MQEKKADGTLLETDPLSKDSDVDGISDGNEDANRDGIWQTNETDPPMIDTDGDSLCDGLCAGQGEDKNLNGVRDKRADGTLLETDPLSKDSDVDGIGDGAEALGTWCYSNQAGPCSNPVLDPKNPDNDADGLRDGQETAGWKVGICYERTIEAKTNYSVTSDPLRVNSDGDMLSDFSEFLNGSDPRMHDTDGDGINDTMEIQLKSSITGIEGSPSVVANLNLSISMEWDWIAFVYLPVRTNITVTFNVSDNVGIDRVQVKLARVVGNGTHTVQIGKGSRAADVSEKFTFSIVELFLTGADLNITAYDVNSNGAWGQFHVDSVAQAVVKAANSPPTSNSMAGSSRSMRKQRPWQGENSI